MTDKEEKLSVRRQCKLLSLHRSTAYYELKPPLEEDLALMRLLDEEYLLHPWKGSRLMREWLRDKGHEVNRKRVQRLMRLIGIAGLSPKRSTSKPHPGHKRYPYLLRDLTVTRANQVWATDITYIPMAHGFVYLVAIIDWYSRMVLAWRIAVHRRDLHVGAPSARHPDQHGRPGLLARQRAGRAPVAIPEVPGGVPARVRRRAPCASRDRECAG